MDHNQLLNFLLKIKCTKIKGPKKKIAKVLDMKALTRPPNGHIQL